MMKLEVVPATANQMPVVANLIELYAHDFSEFYPLEIGEDGRFGYESLALYWREARRHVYLVRLDGKLAGLVMVKQENSGVFDMAEFFILRGCRRRGIGSRVAREVWKKFPGPWEVRVMEANVAARHFWARAISEFAGEAIEPVRMEKGGRGWMIFSFESG